MIAEDIGIIVSLRNDIVSAAVREALSNMGFRIVVENGNNAQEHGAEGPHNYDMLITDMNLQSAASVNVVMQLKKNVYPKSLSILLIAQECEREYYLPALGTGMIDEFLVYPFTLGSLKTRIFKCIFKTVAENIFVLVVDDAAPMRNSIKYSLQQIGFRHVDTAISGQDALAAIRSKTYQIVITDLNMPQMTGIELVEVMQKNEALRRIPVLVLTAENEKKQVLSLIRAGVSGYILKPYTLESLQEKIMGLSSYLL